MARAKHNTIPLSALMSMLLAAVIASAPVTTLIILSERMEALQ